MVKKRHRKFWSKKLNEKEDPNTKTSSLSENVQKIQGGKKIEILENLKQEQQKRETEKQNNQISVSDIDIFLTGGRFDKWKDNLCKFASLNFDIHSERNDVISKVGDNRLCIKLDGKTYFIQKGVDLCGRPLNSAIRVNKEIPNEACEKILEDGEIFEVYDGKISFNDVASHINEISQR